jgi:hypothetical protein
MRLVDAVFRHGHLSEQSLVEALLTGDRPAHLDRCDVCAERAVDMGRWLSEVRAIATEEAEAAFPPERLAIQQAQILRRLEQLDQPSRVIAFPNHYRLDTPAVHARRVSPAWVGVAAAAGLVLGVIGGQVTARMGATSGAMTAQRAPTEQAPPAPAGPSIFDFDLENTSLSGTPVGVLDEMTPRAIDTVASARAGG